MMLKIPFELYGKDLTFLQFCPGQGPFGHALLKLPWALDRAAIYCLHSQTSFVHCKKYPWRGEGRGRECCFLRDKCVQYKLTKQVDAFPPGFPLMHKPLNQVV